jgi:hypothetical protein
MDTMFRITNAWLWIPKVTGYNQLLKDLAMKAEQLVRKFVLTIVTEAHNFCKNLKISLAEKLFLLAK